MSNRQDRQEKQAALVWSHRVNATVRIPPPSCEPALAVAAMFGLEQPAPETLYRDFDLTVRPGQIVAVVGPSGAGKSVLLREVCKAHPRARTLRTAELSRDRRTAVAALSGGTLAARLAVLSRCGLADAGALVRPARNLSGGQLYRLALAEALHRAARARRPALVVADEFAASLDDRTADILCRQLRKLIGPASRLTLMVATPRAALLEALQPDVIIIKPLGEPPQLIEGRRKRGLSTFPCFKSRQPSIGVRSCWFPGLTNAEGKSGMSPFSHGPLPTVHLPRPTRRRREKGTGSVPTDPYGQAARRGDFVVCPLRVRMESRRLSPFLRVPRRRRRKRGHSTFPLRV